jgi:hypothetical protein
MLRWDWYVFRKNHDGTRYDEHVFLDPAGSVAHVVHSGASGARNVEALFFMLGWDQYGFDKKCIGARYTELLFLASSGICGSRSAFWWVWGGNH